MNKRAAALCAVMLLAVLALGATFRGKSEVPYKVYVILGMHANFYHSWRGDTPDEAGFGTDIRIVREIIRMLDEANAQGLDARAYWEGESLFTFEDIVPKHAPDIIEGIRRRIEAGRDEFMPAPYSNTYYSAATEDEMRAVTRWSISNPWGSGAKDLFGGYVPLIRPQEGTATAGMNRILLDEGFQGVVLAYSTYSFTTFSNFVPVLPIIERYGLTTLKMKDDDPPVILFPCVSAADVVNMISLEKWLLNLREMQTSGKVKSDLVIHMNFDADSETWLPLLPGPLGEIPNSGGLPEFIKDVNKYDWSEFTLPSAFMKDREPVGEVMVRQDTADGGWDGNYSWAEKYPSHQIWTMMEKSRLYGEEAMAFLRGSPEAARKKANKLLTEGRDSAFFERIRGLSTTHYGMSTPLVNEERQAVAEAVAGRAMARSDEARRVAADLIADEFKAKPQTLYAFEVRDLRASGEAAVTSILRLPLILPSSDIALELTGDHGDQTDFSLIDKKPLPGGREASTLLVFLDLKPGESRRLFLNQIRAITTAPEGCAPQPRTLEKLDNGSVTLTLDKSSGVKSLVMAGYQFGGDDFLSPFITYVTDKKPKTFTAGAYKFVDLGGERWGGISRAHISTEIPINTPDGEARAALEVTFTLPADKPFLLADVAVEYPYTIKRDVVHNVQQKLRRYLDLRWIEVAPFQFHPRFNATREDPLRVWKHNFLGVTSYYDMNYGQINAKNANWDSMNHQITAGWVAVTDGERGLLIGEDARVLSTFAFTPMRIREVEGKQCLWINPFGSYFGKQADYSHLGGNGVGSEIADSVSAALRPNGPSFNGMKENFSLLLIGYQGDRPPAETEAQAQAFFHSPAVAYLASPDFVDARFADDVTAKVAGIEREEARKAEGPLAAPLAFLVNPTERAVDVVWDEPDDARIDGYEIQYRLTEVGEWKSMAVGKVRRARIDGLENGWHMEFRLRSTGTGRSSGWTETLAFTIGPVKTGSILNTAGNVSGSLVGKVFYYSFVHFLTTP